jgi:hypothetical protein
VPDGRGINAELLGGHGQRLPGFVQIHGSPKVGHGELAVVPGYPGSFQSRGGGAPVNTVLCGQVFEDLIPPDRRRLNQAPRCPVADGVAAFRPGLYLVDEHQNPLLALRISAGCDGGE